MSQVAIIHGWSDKSASFRPLRDFLAANGVKVAEVWLADYISLDDDVRVEDVAKRMQTVVQDLIARGVLKAPFDVIIHSTGGLVVREWLATFYPDGKDAPVKRVVMLAPANFGSKLAAVGKSMLGRLIKGWNNRLETGEEMLKALELASPYSFNLAQRDLLRRPGETRKGPYGRGRVWPFVIIGTRAYDDGLQQVVNENASDGTVRVPAANLNAVGMTIDFSDSGGPVKVTPWETMHDAKAIPFAVLPERDHSEITKPASSGNASDAYGRRLGQLILRALRCNSDADYDTIADEWDAVSEATAGLADDADGAKRAQVFAGKDKPSVDHFRQHMQIVVMVKDDYGNLVDDFFVEFYDPSIQTAKAAGNKSAQLHQKVLQAVHNNSVTAAYRCLYADRTSLLTNIYAERTTSVAVRIWATAPGRNVRYFDAAVNNAAGHLLVHAADPTVKEALSARLYKNRTHLLEVIIPRRPIDKVFGLSQ